MQPWRLHWLKKSIYGLKQSPREWYRLLHDVLVSMGFYRTQADHSIFIKKDENLHKHGHDSLHTDNSLYVMVYVDDLLVLSPSGEMHFQALKRVFRYLAGSKNLSISFSPQEDPALCGYCDADWAGPHSEKGLSTSGFVFKMAGGPIS
ncbi:MAG: hypothetical protein LBE43_02335 [Staphylococcus aureus]|nr:hypothetical protein [Staphylococcus aureus]